MFKNSTLFGAYFILLKTAPNIRGNEMEEVPHRNTLQYTKFYYIS